jgi:hypothetical protein
MTYFQSQTVNLPEGTSWLYSGFNDVNIMMVDNDGYIWLYQLMMINNLHHGHSNDG